MPAAARAMHFGAWHADFIVGFGAYATGQRRVETWPARSAFKLGSRRKQPLVTAGADKCALALFAVKRARIRPFGIFAAQHAVGSRRQALFPFLGECFTVAL